MQVLFGVVIAMALGLGFTLVNQAEAQDSRYQPWSDPNAPKAADGLLTDLDALIDKAERDRAASPGFLDDLRALSQRYRGVPDKRLLFSDNFKDGDFTRSPAWTVSTGEYWVEKDWGLRSAVDATSSAQATGQSEQKKLRGEDVAIAVFGAILGAQQGGQTSTNSQQGGQSASKAAIHVNQPITNAFEAELLLSSWKAKGEWEMAIYQGANRQAGYRMVYQSGAPVQLVRFSRRGAQVMGASAQALALEDKKPHQLRLVRDRFGRMVLSHNGAPIVTVEDRAFQDDFDGLEITNRRGDFIVQGLSVWGR